MSESEEAPTRHQKVLIAFKELTAPLVRLAAVAVGLSGIAYVLGWSYLRGQFRGYGVPWALQMLDATHFISAALGPLLLFSLLLAVSLYIYVDGNMTKKGVLRSAMYFLAASVACFAIHYSLKNWVFENYQSHWNIPALLLVFIAGLQFFAAIVINTVDHFSPTTTTNMVSLGYLIVVAIASMAPSIAESAAKKRLGDMNFTPVSMAHGSELCSWGIVHALSQERFLLISLTDGKNFRIVDSRDVLIIHSTNSNACERK